MINKKTEKGQHCRHRHNVLDQKKLYTKVLKGKICLFCLQLSPEKVGFISIKYHDCERQGKVPRYNFD